MRIQLSSTCVNQGSLCLPAPSKIPSSARRKRLVLPRCNKTTQTQRGPWKNNTSPEFSDSKKFHIWIIDLPSYKLIWPGVHCIPAACGASFAHRIGKHAQQVPREVIHPKGKRLWTDQWPSKKGHRAPPSSGPSCAMTSTMEPKVTLSRVDFWGCHWRSPSS